MRYRVISESGQLMKVMLVRAELERKVNEALGKLGSARRRERFTGGDAFASVVIFSQALVAKD